jgi:hypothetical protein
MRKQKFLEEIEQVMPWAAVEALIEPYAPGVMKESALDMQ